MIFDQAVQTCIFDANWDARGGADHKKRRLGDSDNDPSDSSDSTDATEVAQLKALICEDEVTTLKDEMTTAHEDNRRLREEIRRLREEQASAAAVARW